LADYRKLSLVYRLFPYNDPIPNIDLTITNRDKQLCKPLIRLFQGTGAEKEILDSLSILLEEKKDRKQNTIEAVLYRTINNLIGKELERKKNEGQAGYLIRILGRDSTHGQSYSYQVYLLAPSQ